MGRVHWDISFRDRVRLTRLRLPATGHKPRLGALASDQNKSCPTKRNVPKASNACTPPGKERAPCASPLLYHRHMCCPWRCVRCASYAAVSGAVCVLVFRVLMLAKRQVGVQIRGATTITMVIKLHQVLGTEHTTRCCGRTLLLLLLLYFCCCGGCDCRHPCCRC